LAIAIYQSNATVHRAAPGNPGSPSSQIDGLQPGTIVAARVLARSADGDVKLAIGNTLIAATTRGTA
jgi:hypothetical protein